MAQTISILSTFCVLTVTYFLFCTVQSQLQIAPGTTYDELYTSAINKYNDENWRDTIFYMEHAIKEFKFYRVKLTECRVKCHNLSQIVLPEKHHLNELKFFHSIFKKVACLKTCKSAKLGKRLDRISEDATTKFLTLMPYSYLQFAYYKQQTYFKAQCAAYTYLQAHPEDEVMKNNLEYYINVYGAQNETIMDLEEKPQQKYFLDGNSAHEAGNFSGVIEQFELALKYYWWAEDECRALCEGQYDSREFLDLYESIAGHYAHNLQCKDNCDAYLATMDGKVMDEYLPMHYHYLQYAYYKEGKVQEAVNCAATYLLMIPGDQDMESNMHYYEEELGVNKYQVRIRHKAQVYWDRRELEKEAMQFARTYFWHELEDEMDKNVGDYGSAEPIDPKEVQLKRGAHFLGPEHDEEDDEEDDIDEVFAERGKRGDVGSILEKGQDDNHTSQKDLTQQEDSEEVLNDVEDEEENYYDYPEEDEELVDDDYFEPERPHITEQKLERQRREETAKEDDPEFKFYENFKTNSDEIRVAALNEKMKKKMAIEQDQPDLPLGPNRKDHQKEDLGTIYKSTLSFDMIKQMASDASRVPYPSLAGIELYKDEEALMGPSRVAVDGMASEEECDTLIKLLSEEAVYGDGYKGRTQPFSEHEKFEGITVKDAVDAAADDRVPLFFPATYIYLAERARAFAQRFFGLPTHLYFSFTHLVCRQAKRGSPSNRQDLSHPVHADNCIVDHENNVCHKSEPAFTWRDFSALLYLNDDCEGGNFMFSDYDNNSQAEVAPKCGRLVTFPGGDLHGVRAVVKGQRCALAMWYTLDPFHQELDMVLSWKKIEEILTERQKREKDESTEEDFTSMEREEL